MTELVPDTDGRTSLVGSALRRARQDADLTIDAIAGRLRQLLGADAPTHSTLQRWEASGTARVPGSVAGVLAAILEVPLSVLQTAPPTPPAERFATGRFYRVPGGDLRAAREARSLSLVRVEAELSLTLDEASVPSRNKLREWEVETTAEVPEATAAALAELYGAPRLVRRKLHEGQIPVFWRR